jgi:cytochrome b involved in lipid metabolism
MGAAASAEQDALQVFDAIRFDHEERRARKAIVDECVAAMAALDPFNAEEMKGHASASSCWIIIHGKVCDCTKWQAGHPGGAGSLRSAAGGEDATKTFTSIHAPSTLLSYKKYVVGAPMRRPPSLDGCTEPIPVLPPSSTFLVSA